MNIRTPQTGDKSSASEDRIIISQLRDSQTRDFSIQRKFKSPSIVVGQITEVLAGVAEPRYKWDLIYVLDPGTDDLEYVNSLMSGDNEDLPYLCEINRADGDAPNWSVGDYVIVHIYESSDGTHYIIDSNPERRLSVFQAPTDAVAVTTSLRETDVDDEHIHISGDRYGAPDDEKIIFVVYVADSDPPRIEVRHATTAQKTGVDPSYSIPNTFNNIYVDEWGHILGYD